MKMQKHNESALTCQMNECRYNLSDPKAIFTNQKPVVKTVTGRPPATTVEVQQVM